MPIPRLTIADAFARKRSEGKIALMPFVAAGYPTLDCLGPTLISLEQAGASMVEVGIPFSDPIADGPTIQAAFTTALARGTKLNHVLGGVQAVRARVSIPLLAMVSYSIAFRIGPDRFADQLRSAGFDGVILPDLPPPEAYPVCKIMQDKGLDTVLLVAPSTPDSRRSEIAQLSSGFVYVLSVQGITGERDQLPAALADNVRSLKRLTDRPIAVGFGVSKASHLQQLQGLADGAIVGTALVKRMGLAEPDPMAVADAAGAFTRELLSGVG